MSNYDKHLFEQNLANAMANRNTKMLHEHLIKATADVQFLIKDLQGVNKHADPLVHLLVLPLISQAAKIQAELAAISDAVDQVERANSWSAEGGTFTGQNPNR